MWESSSASLFPWLENKHGPNSRSAAGNVLFVNRDGLCQLLHMRRETTSSRFENLWASPRKDALAASAWISKCKWVVVLVYIFVVEVFCCIIRKLFAVSYPTHQLNKQHLCLQASWTGIPQKLRQFAGGFCWVMSLLTGNEQLQLSSGSGGSTRSLSRRILMLTMSIETKTNLQRLSRHESTSVRGVYNHREQLPSSFFCTC